MNGSGYRASTKTEGSSNELAAPRFEARSRHFKSLIRSFFTFRATVRHAGDILRV